MGAILSYFGYASQQQTNIRSNEHVLQQLHQCCGQIVILGNGHAASPSVIDLCTHLIAQEKDLLLARAGNTNRDAVIKYLLQHHASNSRVEEITVQLKAQFLVLKMSIDRTDKENEEIKDRLRKAEGAIVALATPSVPDAPSQSTSISNCSDSPAKSEAVTEDLIDLGCSQESDSARLMEEDSTLRDEFSENESDNEVESQGTGTTPYQALHDFADLEYCGRPYLVHFADKTEDQSKDPGISEESSDSSTESSSSRSGLSSTATSFTSTSSEISSLKDIHSKLLNESFSQLKALESEGSNLDQSMAIVNTLADKISSLGTRVQVDPFEPTSEAPTEAQDSQALAGGINIEPCWSSEKIFDSAQDRKNAIRVNKGNSRFGARYISCPEFFKHGIHYVPKAHEQDTHRTVAISGLSSSVTMKALLGKVRGGIIFDAKLLDTSKITGSNTALVTFLHEYSAMAYEDHTRQHRITFSNAVAHIAVVPTPTWPIPFSLRSGIATSGHTRCFEVHNFPRNISQAAVRAELTSSPVMKSNSLECMRLGADGILGLRFSSIRAAVYSTTLFCKTSRYRGCTVKYIPDPCAQPLETLLEHIDASGTAVKEDNSKPSCDSDAKARADEDLGRLTKVDWGMEAETRRGRGFEEQIDSSTHAMHGSADHSTSSPPSSVHTTAPLRKETAASISSFAKPYFLSSE